MTDPAKPNTPVRVLVVDDEEPVCVAMERVLRARGYEVVTATDALAGLKAVSAGGLDVILSDIAMPKMDGLMFMRRVREVDLDVPVILVTGLPTMDTVKQAIDQGAFRYLTKPVENQALLKAVAQAVVAHKLTLLKRQAAALGGRDGAGPGDKVGLAARFDKALASLWIAYQPIVRVTDGSVFGYEALMRSVEPSLPHPGAVLDAAEKLGRTVELGRVIRTRAPEPMTAVPADQVLFVNLHPEELMDTDLFASDAALSLIAPRTILEITERATIHDMQAIQDRIAKLRALGFRIAIDDLGAGYAGLTSFAVLEPEIVKLDMSLTRNVDTDPMRQRIVKSMVALCKEVGAQVVAEGIERASERDMVAGLGCDFVQGYFVAKPGKPFPTVNW